MRSERGFTLLESLTVFAVIGTLAAVAISQMGNQRANAFSARAHSLMRDVVTAQEAYFIDRDTYADDLSDLNTVTLAQGVVLEITAASDTGWRARSYHPAGSKTYCFDGYSNAVVVDLGSPGALCP